MAGEEISIVRQRALPWQEKCCFPPEEAWCGWKRWGNTGSWALALLEGCPDVWFRPVTTHLTQPQGLEAGQPAPGACGEVATCKTETLDYYYLLDGLALSAATAAAKEKMRQTSQFATGLV
jgi:hypothetical protein